MDLDAVKELHINNKLVSELYVAGDLAYVYFDDLSSWNSESVSYLEYGTVLDTATILDNEYNLLSCPNPIQANGAGNYSWQMVTKHVAVNAAHYQTLLPSSDSSYARLYKQVYGDEITATVYTTGKENLKEWALNNGWTESQLSGIYGLEDIEMLPLSGDGYPDELSVFQPYFMSQETVDELFSRDSLCKLIGWRTLQTSGTQSKTYLSPVVFKDNSTFYNLSSDNGQKLLFKNVRNLPGAVNPQPPIYSGDSGKSIFMRLDGHNVYAMHIYGTMGQGGKGPDYVKAFPILSAYCASKGDTIKEYTP